MPQLYVRSGRLISFIILPLLWMALSAHANEGDEGGRIVHDAIQVDPQAEFKAPTAIIEGNRAGVSDPLVIVVNGRRYEIPSMDSIPQELRGHYNKLTPEYQSMFAVNRVVFLTRAAQLLSTSVLGNMFGTGAIVKDRVRWTWDHLKNFMTPPQRGGLSDPGYFFGSAPAQERLSGAEIELRMAQERARQEANDVETELMLKTFKERRQEIIQRMLVNLDRSFWSRPALVANSNEVGIFGSVGLTAFMGGQLRDTKKGFGGSFDIGVFIGWNKSDSSAVVQFFRMTETFRGTMTAVTGNAAIVPKWGMMFANVMPGSETRAERGTVHYPPTPPGVSSYFLTSPNRFAVGMNPPVGLIPWPLDSILIYSMDYKMKPMLRIGLRFEVLKDFIKIDTGPKGEFRGMVKSSVRRSIHWVQAKATGRSMCVGAHGRF